MNYLNKLPNLEELLKHERLAPTLILVTGVLLASWMGVAGNGGFTVGEWAPVALILAALALMGLAAGTFGVARSRWTTAALVLFAAYATWTFASLLWSANRGDAWVGAGQTLLYLLVFWLAVSLVSLGASRIWVLVASIIGPAIIATLTLPALASRAEELFLNGRLLGTVNYFSGEAAFLLVPFWVAVYLAGSRRVSPIARGAALAGTVVSVDVAVLTQSRGAVVAMALSLPVFFLISNQRLRGLFALAPIALVLLIAFPSLNEVYLAFQYDESAETAIGRVLPTVGLTAVGAGVYGFLWGLADRRWDVTSSVTRVVGGVALVGIVAVLVFGAFAAVERVGNPVSWGEQRWEAFKGGEETDRSEEPDQEEQSRYLAASGSGRYTLWQVAWEDFSSHPLLGVGTHNYEATYYQLRERRAGIVRQPHSLPLEVLAERGVVGGVLFFGFLATCVGAGLWRRFEHLDHEGKAQVGAMTAAIAYWLVHSSAEWFWQLPAVTLPVMVYLAMLVGPWGRVEAAPLGLPLRAIGAGAALLAVVAVAPLYTADRFLERKEAAANPQEALAAVERAQFFNPLDARLRLHEAESAAKVGDRARVERAFDEAIRLNPEHYAPYSVQGKFYERVGEKEQALQSYRQALALNPLEYEDVTREINRLEGR